MAVIADAVVQAGIVLGCTVAVAEAAAEADFDGTVAARFEETPRWWVCFQDHQKCDGCSAWVLQKDCCS